MFLLGRAGPQALVRFGVRFKSMGKVRMKPKDASAAKTEVPRDAMGRPILPQREKSIGTFNSLSETTLTHELFETDGIGRVELDLPLLQPRALGPGIATQFTDDPVSPHRVYGLPKHMLLEFRILGTPCSVTTSTTLSLIRALEESRENPARLVLNGRPGCGKSFLLLQAAEYAAASGEWIVLYIPRTRRFVDGSTPYSYSLATRTYLQHRAARETLHRLGTVNAHIFDYLTISQPIEFAPEVVLEEGTPLPDVIAAAMKEEAYAVDALEAIMREIAEQDDFPVLIAIDDFQTLAGRTLYRDPRYKMIRPHHLSMPRLLLEYATGVKPLSCGLVLGALSRSDTQFPISAQLAEALRLPVDFAPSPRSVRERRSAQLAMYLENPAPPPREPESDLEWIPEEESGDEGEAEQEQLEADADSEADSAAEVEGAEAAAEEPLPEENELEQEESEKEESELEQEESEKEDSELEQEESDKEESENENESDEEDEENMLTEEEWLTTQSDEITWTGWQVYDPPTYEDSITPTPAQPFPVPRAPEVWRQLRLRDAEEMEADADAEAAEEANMEEDDERGAESVEDGPPGLQNRKKQQQTREQGLQGVERALRAIRVPDALTIREAAALFEVWLDTGILRTGGERRASRRTEIETMEEWREIKEDMEEEESDDEGLDSLQFDGAESDGAELDPLEAAMENEEDVEEDEADEAEFESLDAELQDDLEERPDSFIEEMEEAVLELERRAQEGKVMEMAHEEGELEEMTAEDGALLEDDASVDEQVFLTDDALLSEEDAGLSASEQGEYDTDVDDVGVSASEQEEYDTDADDAAVPASEQEEHDADADDAGLPASEQEEHATDAEADAYDTDAEADAYDTDGESDHSKLDLGDDQEIARTLSSALVDTLQDANIGEEMLKNPFLPNAPVSTETGADDLFLGKYTESSGNPRAFVAGLVGSLQTYT